MKDKGYDRVEACVRPYTGFNTGDRRLKRCDDRSEGDDSPRRNLVYSCTRMSDWTSVNREEPEPNSGERRATCLGTESDHDAVYYCQLPRTSPRSQM
jgi:hypothetical protein